MNKIQVVIVSQQFLFRQGIEQALSEMKDIKISATAGVNDGMLDIIDTLPPDVALVDIDTPSEIRRVARGEHPINESLTDRPKLAEQVLYQFQELSWRSEAEGFIAPLTPREMEILNYIAQGYLNKQIAAELDISEQTIKNHP